jgi:hypothetical protein
LEALQNHFVGIGCRYGVCVHPFHLHITKTGS